MFEDNRPVLLLMNDLHVGKETINDFKLNFDEAIKTCEQYGIQHIVIGGDLFQSRASQTLSVLLAVKNMLHVCTREYGIKVTILEGNHDKVDQEQDDGYCRLFDSIEGVTVIEDYLTFMDDDCNFVLHVIGYYPEQGSFVRKLQDVIDSELDPIKKNFLYIHEGINGALERPSDNELPCSIFKDFDKVFVGHYHNRCIIPGTDIEYIGSSRQHNFGEDEEKGYTIVFTSGKTSFVKNESNVRYKVLEVGFKQIGITLCDKISELKEDGYKVKIKINCTKDKVSSIDKQALMNAGASKIEITTTDSLPEHLKQSSLSKFDKQSISSAYEEFCEEKKIDDVEAGINYLSKI